VPSVELGNDAVRSGKRVELVSGQDSYLITLDNEGKAMRNVLIVNAHLVYEGWSEGRLNAHLASVIEAEMRARGYQVRHTHIEQGYDPEEEVEKHCWADLIVLQSPVNWFGAPWIHKKYLDEVFNAGLASQKLIVSDGRTREDPSQQYGSGGLMQGKQLMMSLTWNAPESAFGNVEQLVYEGGTADDAFLHIAACYRFCGCQVLPSFNCFDVLKVPDVVGNLERLKRHLSEYLDYSEPVAASDVA